MEEFYRLIRPLLNGDFPRFEQALGEAPALALRLNPLRPDAQKAAGRFLDSPVPWAEGGYYITENTRPGADILHAAGAYYMQEASAMLPAAALDVQPGERVLDLCAAPGGKTTQLAAKMHGRGLLVANEKETSRARVLAGNLERMGVSNAVVTNMAAQDLCRRLDCTFDAVLVDAPCSGEGMFRRDPDARGEWSPEAPAGCAKRQKEILSFAAGVVRPGGRMVYSTCTFNDTENEGVVRAFLEENPDFEPFDFALPGMGSSTSGTMRLWPHLKRGDGHFVARFRKKGEDECTGVTTVSRPKDLVRLVDELEKLRLGTLPETVGTGSLLLYEKRLFAVPAGAPALERVRVVSPGLAVLRAEKNRVEPEHALAMALENPAKCAELSAQEAARFLAGEVVPVGDALSGWTVAQYLGMPLGWGKASGGMLKNHLPKGLRRSLHGE